MRGGATARLPAGTTRCTAGFPALDAARLEDVLASMPLRVWSSDEVAPLAQHPNDPGPASTGAWGAAKEFLVAFAPAAYEGAASQAPADATAIRCLWHRGTPWRRRR
ncbi:muconolactone Delta-isomerase family protein [Streptomyces sp. NPDC001852]|uniref:muconolactone Delta-isomerase family protein n=1 Tax=Streptomyces sp. NPDC001852 TaxID=3364619 RepID=UPI00369852C4